VDDIVLTASSQQLLHRVISALKNKFAMKDLGPLHHFLGVAVQHHKDTLFLSQRQYTLESGHTYSPWHEQLQTMFHTG
jgi:hypothetical protein